MTVAAAPNASLPLRKLIRVAALTVLGGLLMTSASTARAQFGALLSAYSDDRYRGVSLSDGHPVAILDLSYDARGGAYAALSGRFVAAGTEGPQPLGLNVNGGYAWRLNPRLSADVGLVHSSYSSYSGIPGGRSYTEGYAAISGRVIGARLSISPDYLGIARWTAYGEIDGHLDLSRRTLLEARVGVLTPLGGKYRSNNGPQVDGRLGIAQQLGRVTIHAAMTTRSRDHLYRAASQHRTGFIVGISTAL